MDNYEFCANWVLDQPLAATEKILDFGCGEGKIVHKLRNRNRPAFGCDTFYEGGDYSNLVESDYLNTGIVKRMHDNTIPFDSKTFSAVVSNQVFEHVQELDTALAEINRVLVPGGLFLSIFPDKGVWREGHCGVPFLHWFPKRSTFRTYYAGAFHTIGFGYFREGKKALTWSRNFCDWLDNWTYYRSRREIMKSYNEYFVNMHHIEDYWFQQRCLAKYPMLNYLPASAMKVLVNKLAGLVIVCQKKS